MQEVLACGFFVMLWSFTRKASANQTGVLGPCFLTISKVAQPLRQLHPPQNTSVPPAG